MEFPNIISDGGKKKFEFNTRGCCLICLKTIPASKCNYSFSIAALLKYLKISIPEVFASGQMHNSSTTAGNVVNLIANSDVRAQLCGDCEILNNRTSELFKALERLQILRMELDFNLDGIRTRIKRATDMPDRMEHFRKEMEGDIYSFIFKKTVTELRDRLSKKCLEATTSSRLVPRVVIERLDCTNRHQRSSTRISTPSPVLSTTGNAFDEIADHPHSPASSLHSDSCPSPQTSNDNNPCKNYSNYSKKKVKRTISYRGTRLWCTVAKCSQSFSDKYALHRHLIHHRINVINAQRRRNRDNMIYNCDRCKKVFHGKWNLKKHKEYVHFGIGGYRCSFSGCTKKYSRWTLMEYHRTTAHLDCKKATLLERRKKISQNKVSASISSAKKKIASAFTSLASTIVSSSNIFDQNSFKCENKFICKVCGKGYTSKKALANHIKAIHYGIRSLCDYPGCSKSYTDKYALANHTRLKHPDLHSSHGTMRNESKPNESKEEKIYLPGLPKIEGTSCIPSSVDTSHDMESQEIVNTEYSYEAKYEVIHAEENNSDLFICAD